MAFSLEVAYMTRIRCKNFGMEFHYFVNHIKTESIGPVILFIINWKISNEQEQLKSKTTENEILQKNVYVGW